MLHQTAAPPNQQEAPGGAILVRSAAHRVFPRFGGSLDLPRAQGLAWRPRERLPLSTRQVGGTDQAHACNGTTSNAAAINPPQPIVITLFTRLEGVQFLLGLERNSKNPAAAFLGAVAQEVLQRCLPVSLSLPAAAL